MVKKGTESLTGPNSPIVVKNFTMERRSPRVGFRFRLQTLFVLLTVFTVAFGLIFLEFGRELWRRQIAAQLRRPEYVHFKSAHELFESPPKAGVVKGYLRLSLGDDYFKEARSVCLDLRSADDVKTLLAFPETEDLHLSGAAVTDALVSKLGDFPQLYSLELDGTQLSERGLQSLSQLSKLRTLSLVNCSLSDDSLQLLAKLPGVQSLRFKSCSLSQETLKPLTQYPKLDSLVFHDSLPSEKSWKLLAELAGLRSLSFAHCTLNDSHLGLMHGAESVVTLELDSTKVTEAGMLALREANPAWSIRFGYGSTYDRSKTERAYLPSVRDMTTVKELTLEGQCWSGGSLAILKEAQGLDVLTLARCSLTEGDLQYLRPLHSLTSLSISGTPITDENLRELEGFTKLRSLRLPDADVTGRGWASIVKLTALESLSLGGASLTEEAIAELAKLTSLRQFYVFERPLSDSSIARLQQALPKCEIQNH